MLSPGQLPIFLKLETTTNQLVYCKAIDTLFKILRTIISKSLDKKIEKAKSLLSTLQVWLFLSSFSLFITAYLLSMTFVIHRLFVHDLLSFIDISSTTFCSWIFHSQFFVVHRLFINFLSIYRVLGLKFVYFFFLLLELVLTKT